jgi:type III restriction enzyme
LIDSLDLDIPAHRWPQAEADSPQRGELLKKEFQELWGRINHKAVYQVEFDSAELIGKCVAALDQHLQVAPLQYVIHAASRPRPLDADDLASG